MMKALLLSLLLIPVLLTGQRSYNVQTSTRTFTGSVSGKTHLMKDAEELLLPPAADLPCYEEGASTQTIPDSGFVFGSNLFGDVIVGQRIVNPSTGTYRVTAAAAGFEFPGEGADDIFLTALIISDPGPDGGEYTVLGESDSVRAGDLEVDEDDLLLTNFTFAQPVVLSDQSFFVAIDFTRAYAIEPPPYIGLLSTIENCGDGDNVIIFTDDGQAESVATYREIYTDDAELFFEVTVDDSLTTGILTPRLADYGIKSFPNPTLDAYTLRFTGQSAAAAYSARLTDLSGRLLRETRPVVTGGVQHRVDWSLADLPAGLYLYHIDGPAGRQSGKLVKR